jgi:hypothetical protein
MTGGADVAGDAADTPGGGVAGVAAEGGSLPAGAAAGASLALGASVGAGVITAGAAGEAGSWIEVVDSTWGSMPR